MFSRKVKIKRVEELPTLVTVDFKMGTEKGEIKRKHEDLDDAEEPVVKISTAVLVN